jgi:formylglycine-generating enzyme required for sulfatase activity
VSLDLKEGGKLVLAPIPAGTFMMGSPATEDKRGDNETQHRVTISKPFYMGIHPVTQAQYQAIMGKNPANFQGNDLPVEQVNWNDAVEFCQKISQKAGRTFRLPTEAEWEYACRAGTTTPFYFGNTISTEQANYDGNYTYGNGVKGVHRQKTTSVGSFPANAWGLHDMHGNVWEWCADWYGDYPAEAAIDPQGVSNGPSRVLRGGSWNNNPQNCRSANRNRNDPDNLHGGGGRGGESPGSAPVPPVLPHLRTNLRGGADGAGIPSGRTSRPSGFQAIAATAIIVRRSSLLRDGGICVEFVAR